MGYINTCVCTRGITGHLLGLIYEYNIITMYLEVELIILMGFSTV